MNIAYDKKLTIDHLNETVKGMKFSPDFIVYDECFLPSVFFDETILDCSGLVYVKTGRFSVTLNGESILAGKGQLFFFKKDDTFSDIMYSPDCTGWIFAASSRLSQENMAMEGLGQFAQLTSGGSVVTPSAEVGRLIELYGEILKVKYNAGMMEIDKTLRALFSDVYRGIEYSEGFNEEGKKSAGNLYRRFLALLSQTNPKPRELGWYAERLGVNPKYLTTVSRKVSGETAMYRINEAIMADIRKFLRHSEDSIAQIAAKTGFNNNAFFGKYVKHHSGMTPLHLRAYLREKDTPTPPTLNP